MPNIYLWLKFITIGISKLYNKQTEFFHLKNKKKISNELQLQILYSDKSGNAKSFRSGIKKFCLIHTHVKTERSDLEICGYVYLNITSRHRKIRCETNIVQLSQAADF